MPDSGPEAGERLLQLLHQDVLVAQQRVRVSEPTVHLHSPLEEPEQNERFVMDANINANFYQFCGSGINSFRFRILILILFWILHAFFLIFYS